MSIEFIIVCLCAIIYCGVNYGSGLCFMKLFYFGPKSTFQKPVYRKRHGPPAELLNVSSSTFAPNKVCISLAANHFCCLCSLCLCAIMHCSINYRSGVCFMKLFYFGPKLPVPKAGIPQMTWSIC